MNHLSVSERVSRLKPSATVAMSNRAKSMQESGKDVLSFAAGQPDFDTPERIRRAASEALEAGQTRYMPTLGDPLTRGVIADKLLHENGIEGLTPKHVGISAGAKHALYVTCQCLLDEGDEALLPVPAWVSYAPLIELAGGRVVEIPTSAETGFKITPKQLIEAVTPRSKMLVLNSPCNPTGTMYTPDEIRALADAIVTAVEKAPNLVIVTDEIYERIVYGGNEHLSLGSISSVASRVITINGLSKSFAMTGWRVGYVACPGDFGAKFMGAYGTLQGQMTTNITSFVYPSVRVALTECDEEVQRFCAAFAKRASLISRRLDEIDGVSYVKPMGTFYVFPDVSAYFSQTSAEGKKIHAAHDLAEALLDEAGVAVVPGEDFGGCGPNHLRISFACGEQQINEGMDRFAAFLSSLS